MVEIDTNQTEHDPSHFGHFSVARVLGQGSFGRAYLVYKDDDQSKNLPFALKWLRQGAEEGALARFENELWALKNLDHPAFPKFVSNGSESSRPYVVMGFAEGRTVGDRIRDNDAHRTFFSELSVLLIAQRLLEALIYLDERQLMHRDIKDENVIVSSSGEDVTLIDLGLCKGMVLPVQNETFWNAGAARFAPPAKLDNASGSIISHDVFAVGVLCYRMLTNIYPWEVGADKGPGDLKTAMLTKNPVAIQEINSAADHGICAAIMQMLDPRDYSRIQLNQALIRVKTLRAASEIAALPAIAKGPPLRLSRVVRDPVHGDIQMTDLEFAVLNCKEVQRLRRIRQLGTTHLVYPGAEHSRLSHAIGVVHVVERILRAIEMREGFSFSSVERWTGRLSALIHDITHAPFGHTLEDELGFFTRHDRNTARLDRLFNRPDAELPAILEATEVGRAAVDLLYGTTGRSPLSWIESLLSGSVGADALDYVDRDSFYCGLDNRIDSAIYRRFTLDRLGTAGVSEKEIVPRLYGNHGPRLDADHAVLSVLEARYALFLKVYSHSVKTAAGAMIGKALALAIQDTPDIFDESVIEVLGDEQLLTLLEQRGPDDAKRLIRFYQDRKLFRPAFRARIMQGVDASMDSYKIRQDKLKSDGLFDPMRRLDLEKELAKDAGVEACDIILHASPKAPGAKTVSQKVEQSRGEVEVRDSAFSRHQEIFARHLALWNLYLFCRQDIARDKKDRLSALMKQKFGLNDELKQHRIQLALNL